MLIKSHKNQIIWSNDNCTVTLNLSPCLGKWLVTTTCKFMKTEYGALDEAFHDFEVGTRLLKSNASVKKKAAA